MVIVLVCIIRLLQLEFPGSLITCEIKTIINRAIHLKNNLFPRIHYNDG